MLQWSYVTAGKYHYYSHSTAPRCRATPHGIKKTQTELSVPPSGTPISLSKCWWVKCWEAAFPHPGISGNWDWVKAFQAWITLQKQVLANINQRLKVSFHTVPSICITWSGWRESSLVFLENKNHQTNSLNKNGIINLKSNKKPTRKTKTKPKKSILFILSSPLRLEEVTGVEIHWRSWPVQGTTGCVLTCPAPVTAGSSRPWANLGRRGRNPRGAKGRQPSHNHGRRAPAAPQGWRLPLRGRQPAPCHSRGRLRGGRGFGRPAGCGRGRLTPG